ncbi:type II secretion system GspH family protein [Luteimonas sp. BDR2-5]|uniref:type II secretion system protein n=1 Tax=Proluteimonas luteida TaxID=2878685 RepID=UPI001E3A9547|nr:type II secretion system protein [Luteimonas sp. BDR2-5]MCD9026850.1 type II secretion system GspH family protein [Luteimonas sp. BDR2-5]
MNRRGLTGGFSLIELIVVVAIVSVLLLVAYPRYQSSVDRAEYVALLGNLQQFRKTIDHYYEDKGRYPDSLERLVQENYLRSVPVDPITGSSGTWILMRGTGIDTSGIVDVRSGAHGVSWSGVPYSELTP